MTTLNTSPPRGMRDFYPEDFRLREHIFNAWRTAACSHGFEFVDAAPVEALALLERKSGEEISEQLYTFADKSGRALALRAEFTPSLARMMLARRPLLRSTQKWSAIAQCFRYERMSRGRKREHFQWNLDVIGAASCVAEVETLSAACMALRNLGFSEEDVQVRVGSRRLLAELYARFNFAPEHFSAWSRVLDKRDKLSDAGLQDMLVQCGFDDTAIRQTLEISRIESMEAATELLGPSAAVTELKRFFTLGAAAGLENLLTFDAGIVRGLDYYTGIVFEAFDRAGEFRAIFGGGRYENLFETLGGPSVPCVGLGFGDVVIQELLTARNRLPETGSAIDFCIGYLTDDAQSLAITTAASLRTAGRSAEVAGGPEHAGAFFGRASGSGARHAALIGPDEMTSGTVLAKDLGTGKVLPLDVLLRQKGG